MLGNYEFGDKEEFDYLVCYLDKSNMQGAEFSDDSADGKIVASNYKL